MLLMHDLKELMYASKNMMKADLLGTLLRYIYRLCMYG